MQPNATLEKHFLVEGRRLTEVRALPPSFIPICPHGCCVDRAWGWHPTHLLGTEKAQGTYVPP